MSPLTSHRLLRRPLLGVIAACVLGIANTASAQALTIPVAIPGQSYDPASLTVVAGDTVTWTNQSFQLHTVTARDLSFTSGPLGPQAGFSNTFTQAGVHPYFCSIHLFMQGEVDVVPALLAADTDNLVAGAKATLSGRVAPGTASVSLESAPAGTTAFAPLQDVLVTPDGKFAASVTPQVSTSYRVVAAAGPSAPVTVSVQRNVRLLLSARVVGRSARLRVHVVPGRPGAPVVLQLYDRWHYAWVPFARQRLDPGSWATFVVPSSRRERARVVLASPGGDQVSPAVRTWAGPPRRR